MKSNKIFSFILCLLIFIFSFISVNNYYRLNAYKYDLNKLKKEIDYDQIIYLYSLIDEKDENYEMFSIDFPESFEIQEQENIKQYLYDSIQEINYIGEDENISYYIKKGDQTFINHGQTLHFDENNSLLYVHVSFKSDSIACIGDFCNEYNTFSSRDFIDNFYFSVNVIDGKEMIHLFSNFLPLENITINIPKGYEIYFKINDKIIPNGYVYHHLNTLKPYIIYFVILISICILSLFILYLLLPIRFLENIFIYKYIKNWLLEFNILLFGSILIALGSGLIFLLKYTIDGSIFYHLNISNFIINLMNYLGWFIFYLISSIFIFLFKYILKNGIFIYFKNHTILGIIHLKIKSLINDLMHVNLKYSLLIKLGCILLMNAIIVFILQILCNNSNFEYVIFMIMIYTCILLIPSLLFIDKVYKQYQILLEKTKLLSQGQFDLRISEDVSIFNEYKNELLQVKDGFEKAVQDEIKSNNLRSELITNVSHDLKTPITCIKNYVTLLKDEAIEEDKKKEYIHNIYSYINRLARLVEDLFEVSKASSGNISLDKVELDLVDLVKQVFAENDDILSKNQLQVISKFNCNHMNVKLDSNKTYRIFENLIVNISKYALPYSRVYVEVNETDEHVIVEFKNISKDEMNFNAETITERFVRGDSSRNTNGSGLGLAIVKSYSELQNIDFKITIDGDLFKTTLKFNK